MFDQVPRFWLRWCDRQGNWLPTDTEQAERVAAQERLAREQERLAKEQTQNQILQAAGNLLATGMTIEQIAELLNLSAEQMQRLNPPHS